MSVAGIILSEVYSSIGTIVLMIKSGNEEIERIRGTSYSSKDEMKLVGGIASQYEGKLNELVVLGLAKVVDDVFYIIQTEIDMKCDFWGLNPEPYFYNEVKCIRHCANVIKHHKSYVDGSDQDSKSLIDQYNFKNFSMIHQQFDEHSLVLYAFYVREFCLNFSNKINHIKEIDRRTFPKENIYNYMIVGHLGEYLRLKTV